jgi:hypothetical protein
MVSNVRWHPHHLSYEISHQVIQGSVYTLGTLSMQVFWHTVMHLCRLLTYAQFSKEPIVFAMNLQ